MKKPSVFLVAGLASAALLWIAGTLYTRSLTRHEAELETQCRNSAPAQGEPDVGFVPFCDWKSIQGSYATTPGRVYDPDVLAAYAPVGVQREILDAHQAVVASKAWPLPAVLTLFAVGVIPWLWYFLLRRIAELRAAIGGKPPI
jgi:hypothetical protein